MLAAAKADTPRVLVIAGSDSCGGAGIQADIKVITCLGGYAMTAITAITAQNTQGVSSIHPVPAKFVFDQGDMCLSDIGADAVKIGMLCNKEIIKAVADLLAKHKPPNVVLDPVMISKSGHALIEADAERALIKHLLPLADIVTPNLDEAARLAGIPMEGGLPDMEKAGKTILRLGAKAVLIKGGHLPKRPQDVLITQTERIMFSGERVESKNTHGTGCSFASALATELARGHKLDKAIYRAKLFITEAIRHSLPLGHGHGPTNPMAGAQAITPKPNVIYKVAESEPATGYNR